MAHFIHFVPAGMPITVETMLPSFPCTVCDSTNRHVGDPDVEPNVAWVIAESKRTGVAVGHTPIVCEDCGTVGMLSPFGPTP